MATKILIVEDDLTLQNVLKEFLQDEGFMTDVAGTGSDALRKLEKAQPDLVLLDLGLPDIDGATILQKTRSSYPALPVIILTAKSKPQEIADGLNLGADDYLPKPFSVEELLARINARIKKPLTKNGQIKLADLVLDLNKMTAQRKNKKIDLTKTEFELLRFLMENAGKVQTREMILNHVWDYSSEVESRVVDVYIGYLRNKVDKGTKKKLIKNKRGFGYFIDG